MSLGGSVGRVKLYPGEPKLFLNDPDSGVYQELDRRMTRAQLVARSTVRKRTGRLMASIRKNRAQYMGLPAVLLLAGGGGVKYAMYENDGTVPHIIRARRGKSLRFAVGATHFSGGGSHGSFGGTVVFTRVVHHPGTYGSHFLYPKALDAAGGF